MANKAIRGITIEVGGDTTKLGKALENGEKQSRSLQVELRQIENLLKFDPSNVELLTQKQKVLTESVAETSKKLALLKEAEAQVVAQFEKGEIGEDQLRAFQREILQTESKLGSMKTELDSTETALKQLGDGADIAKKDVDNFETSLDDAKAATEEFKENASEMFDTLKNGATVIAGAAAAAGGYALKLTTEFDKAYNTLQTRTGATTEEMDALNASMENIYANNFGESIEDVAQSMATVETNTKLSGEQLEKATQNALLMRDTFDFDVNESIRAVKMMMDQFGLSADDAYNLIAQGAQNGLDKNGDLLDTVNEYSVHFANLGLDADEMFNMLVNGADNGTFSVDKLGDSVKEFGIRVIDGSDATAEGFAAIGLDADEMAAKFAKGGDDAKSALQQTAKALFNLDDPIAQNTAGVNLFGTMWEDLGADGVKALMDLTGECSSTNDALEQINAVKYDDIGSSIAGLGRTLETEVVKPLGDEVKPAVEDVISHVQQNAPQIKQVLSGIVEKVGEFIKFVINNGGAIISIIGAIGAAFVTWKVAKTIDGLVGKMKSLFSCVKAGNSVMTAFNAVLGINPIVLIVAAIAGLIAAFVLLWKNCEGFREFWINLWEKIKAAFAAVVDWLKKAAASIAQFFTDAWNAIKKAWDAVIDFFVAIWDGIKNAAQAVVDWFVDAWQAVSDFFVGLWEGIKNAFQAAWDWIAGIFSTIAEWVNVNVIQPVANFFTGLWEGIVNAWHTVIDPWIEIVKRLAQLIYDEVITPIANFFTELWNTIKTTAQAVIDWFVAAWNTCASAFTAVWQAVSGFFVGIWNAIKSAIQAVVDWFKSTWQAVSDWFKNIWNAISTFLTGIWNSIKSTVQTVVDWFKSVWTAVSTFFTNLWNGIKNAASNAWNGIKNAFSAVSSWFSENVVEPVKNAFSNAWSALTSGATNAWNGIKSVFSKVASWFKNIFSNAWTAVKNVFSTGGKIFDGIKDGIITAFKAVVNAIIKGINTVVAMPFNGLNGILETISGLSILGVEPFSWLTWRAPVPQIPYLAKGGVVDRPTLAMFGENGREAVVPLEKNTEWTREVAKQISDQQARNVYGGEAMLAKLEAIYDRLDRMQIVLDSGTLIGETIDKIDAGLATRQLLNERGV